MNKNYIMSLSLNLSLFHLWLVLGLGLVLSTFNDTLQISGGKIITSSIQLKYLKADDCIMNNHTIHYA